MTFRSFDALAEYSSTFGLGATEGVFSLEALLRSRGSRTWTLPVTHRGEGRMEILRIDMSQGLHQAVQYIVWHMLYGKNLRLCHLWIISNLLMKLKNYSKGGQSIFNLLAYYNHTLRAIAPAVAYSSNWFQFAPPLRKLVSREDLKILGDSVSWLEPEQAKQFSEKAVIALARETIIFERIPEPNRIGVGYKDKGQLPEPGTEYDPFETSSECSPSIENCWRVFAEHWSQDSHRFNSLAKEKQFSRRPRA